MNHQKYIFPCPCDGVGCPREEPLGKPSSIGVFCGMSNGNPTLLVGVLSRFFRLKSGRGVVGRWLLLIGKRAASKFQSFDVRTLVLQSRKEDKLWPVLPFGWVKQARDRAALMW